MSVPNATTVSISVVNPEGKTSQISPAEEKRKLKKKGSFPNPMARSVSNQDLRVPKVLSGSDLSKHTQNEGNFADKKMYKRHLWDGFEMVTDRLLKARDDLKNAGKFFDLFSSAEMAFASWLRKAGDAARQHRLNDSLWESFKTAKMLTGRWSSLHDATSSDIKKNLNAKIASMVDEIKEVVSKKRAQVSSMNRELEMLKASYLKWKSKYSFVLEKRLKLTATLSDAKRRGKPTKDLQKVSKEVEKARKQEACHRDKFAATVTKLGSHQKSMAAEMETVLQELEILDRGREKVFSETMEYYHKLITDTITFLTKGAEIQKRANDKINIEGDIQTFIARTITGRFPESPITLEKAMSGIQKEEMTRSIIPLANLEESVMEMEGNPSRIESRYESMSEGDLQIELDPAKLSDRIAVALVDWEGDDEEELAFRKGDEFDIVDAPLDEDWWTGTHKGKTGMFPAGFVRLQNFPLPIEPIQKLCEVVYDFESEEKDELTVYKGDLVQVSFVHKDWCVGRVVKRYGLPENGKFGLFPASYVKIERASMRASVSSPRNALFFRSS